MQAQFLQERLKAAVESAKNYEEAARLRDELAPRPRNREGSRHLNNVTERMCFYMTHENQFTPRAEEALRLAQRRPLRKWATAMWAVSIFLLGLMREEDGIAHRVMQEYGMTEDMICTVLGAA